MNEDVCKYCEIEDVGGREETIRRYQSKYVKYFKGIGKVLDIGCGRGIFLDLLKESKIDAEGIDVEEKMIKICRTKGHIVYYKEALEFLSDKESLYGGIFSSHFVEHLSPNLLLKLFELIHNSLVKDGIFIIITPNFHDLQVMSEGFWLTPWHKRPYPLSLLEKLLQHQGFKIIDKGEDKDLKAKYRIWQLPIYYLRKQLLGDYWGRGDNFIAGRKE